MHKSIIMKMTPQEARYFDEFKNFALNKAEEFERNHGGPQVCWSRPSNIILLKAEALGWASDFERTPHYRLGDYTIEHNIKMAIIEFITNP